eukprot:CAMPEP_0184323516 /NCGR_PEP_ID=MMETSP1049-20130417/130727_1 /TAXON_ID=77928 /ORGANISM="Proteomonas sulcata, Strain CCMP704" /LENGTH=89 /DNA_ID=CAMNT_0026645043 /DNA_START=104 /DNA_END=373 /DNA_ORIENTATION=+
MEAADIQITALVVVRAALLMIVRQEAVENDGTSCLGLDLQATGAVCKVGHPSIISSEWKHGFSSLLHIREIEKYCDEPVLSRRNYKPPV